jgi:hypothetical protein
MPRHAVKIERDRTSKGCNCDEMYRVVLVEEETQSVVRVLGSGIKNYEVADNIRRVAEGQHASQGRGRS